MSRLDLAFSGIVAAGGSAWSVFLAQAGTVDPTTAYASLAIYGPLGVISMWGLWRLREKDKEHAATIASLAKTHEEEREQDRAVLVGHMRDMTQAQSKVVEELGRIRGLLERGP